MQPLYEMFLREEMAAFTSHIPGDDPQFDAMLESFDTPMTYWIARAKAKYLQSMEVLGFPPFWVIEQGKAA